MSEVDPRDGQRRARFFFVDGWGGVGLLVWVVHMSYATTIALGLFFLFLLVLERKRMTLPTALRTLKTFLLPPNRPPRPRYRLNRFG